MDKVSERIKKDELKSMNITIKIIHHKKQRYETLGDWIFDKQGNLVIYISDMNNWLYETLIGVHEIIEAVLCKQRGIEEKDVSKFDMEHPELDDPGDDKRACYHKEHIQATFIEKVFAKFMGVRWWKYNEDLDKFSGN